MLGYHLRYDYVLNDVTFLMSLHVYITWQNIKQVQSYTNYVTYMTVHAALHRYVTTGTKFIVWKRCKIRTTRKRSWSENVLAAYNGTEACYSNGMFSLWWIAAVNKWLLSSIMYHYFMDFLRVSVNLHKVKFPLIPCFENTCKLARIAG